jgi:hypothetical protein
VGDIGDRGGLETFGNEQQIEPPKPSDGASAMWMFPFLASKRADGLPAEHRQKTTLE